MTRRLIGALLVVASAVILAPSGAAQSNQASAALGPTGVQELPPRANAHQLAHRVLTAIHRVEQSELDCRIRNRLVRRLQLLHDAITSGRATAARGMLTAWLHNVRTMQGAQLINAEQGSALQVALMSMLHEVGEGWPKEPMPTRNWPKLRSCDPIPGKAHAGKPVSDADVAVTAVAEGVYEGPVLTFDDVGILLSALVGAVPGAGKILGPLLLMLWPNSGPDINALIDDAITEFARDTAINDLSKMQGALNDFLDIAVNNPSQAGAWFSAAEVYISAGLQTFHWNHTSTGGKDYRLEFLPLFAQAQNLYLALLREAVLHGAQWQGWTANDVEYWKGRMRSELDLNNKTIGLGYALDIYQMGLDQQPTGSGQSDWTKRNRYIRQMTRGVLDFAEIWKYMDPDAYPNGVPNLKLTRMIYSDPIGITEHTFRVPPDAYGPLRHLTVWVDGGAVHPFIDAIQQTGGPTAGPIVTGGIMGDSALGNNPTRYDFDVAPGGTKGPIVAVDGYSAMYLPCKPQVLSGLSFTFADGTSTGRLGSQRPELWLWPLSTPCLDKAMRSSTYSFSYPGETVASVQVMGRYNFEGSRWGADSVVFGFRYAGSYYPSGFAINSQTLGCMVPLFVDVGAPVTLGTAMQCYSLGGTWTYNSAFRQLSTQGLCLDTDTDGYAMLNACQDGPTQRWNIIPSGVGGTIGRDGLVLAPSPSLLKLAPDTGAANERWRTPNNVQGPVQAVSAGMCLGHVSSPTSGSGMKIYSCASGLTPGQTWTYSPSMATLSLMGGTMCLDVPGDAAPGTLVEVKDCSGEDSQQWALKSDTARILHVKSGLYLDLWGGSTASSTPVVLGNDTNAISQKWTWPMY